MRKTTLLLSASLLATPSFAGESDVREAMSRSYNTVGQYVVNTLKKVDGVKWLKSSFSSTDKSKLAFNISGFYVPLETREDVSFVQTRIDQTADTTTLNLGIGYRRLFGAYLVGVNAFHDIRSAGDNGRLFAESHRRNSVGVEFKAPLFDAYANSYRNISDIVAEEEVLAGYDAGISGFVDQKVKLHAQMYKFEDKEKNVEHRKEGRKLTASYHPNNVLTLGVEYDRKKEAADTKRVFLEMKIASGSDFETQWNSSVKRSGVSAWSKRYEEVVRTNTVHLKKAVSKMFVKLLSGTGAVEYKGRSASLVLNKKMAHYFNSIVKTDANSSAEITYLGVVSTLGASSEVTAHKKSLKLISGSISN